MQRRRPRRAARRPRSGVREHGDIGTSYARQGFTFPLLFSAAYLQGGKQQVVAGNVQPQSAAAGGQPAAHINKEEARWMRQGVSEVPPHGVYGVGAEKPKEAPWRRLRAGRTKATGGGTRP